ncbi:very short patch repair endonuclease [Pseudarthrobacter sp. H2]|uniref:very short patch repair endonuclease n=1 Tax=Pseudarthrobacter sp. H2 TaxID=3418415 RepID=UPI003CEB332F
MRGLDRNTEAAYVGRVEHSWATTPATRKAMQGNRSRDTEPELAVRRILHAKGLRYRVGIRPLPGLRRTADIAFTRARIAVFIDGCFWHGCPVHYRAPGSNMTYWSAKVSRNRERDLETTGHLVSAGWTVLRFWAHEDPVMVADQIMHALKGT